MGYPGRRCASDLQPKDDTLYNCLTITDLLFNPSGMSCVDNLVVGSENNILIPGKEGIEYVTPWIRLLPFRAQFSYNNLSYDLAGNVIGKVSGYSWCEILYSRIFELLDLDCTFLKEPPSDTSNVAQCYNALDDVTATPIPCPKAGNDRFVGPSAVCVPVSETF